jgi:hypothetical protein
MGNNKMEILKMVNVISYLKKEILEVSRLLKRLMLEQHNI